MAAASPPAGGPPDSVPPGGAETAGEEEDDPVVAEFEVWHSKELFDALNLFQFPLRAANCGYNMRKLQRVQTQLHSRRYRLEFDPRPQAVASGGFGADEEEGEDQGQAVTRTQPFAVTSTRVKNKTNYAVGVVRGDRLTLTALADVHQFRPDLEANRNHNPEHREVLTGTLQRAEDPTGAQARARQVDHSRLESVRQYQSRLRSSWAEQLEREVWLPLSFKSQDELRSKHQVFSKLFCQESSTVPFDPSWHTGRYVRRVFQHVIDPWMRELHWKIPLAMASRVSIKDQVESLLMSAHIMRLSRLRALLVPMMTGDKLPNDVDLIAQYVEPCAVLIRGLWVVKSVPEYRGNLALTREWVLYKLWEKHGTVLRKTLTDPPFALDVDPSVVRRILCDVADFDPAQRSWSLKHGGCDADFLQTHASLVQKQDAAWQARGPAVLQNVKAHGGTGRPTMVTTHSNRPAVQASGARTAVDPRQLPKQLGDFLRKSFSSKGVWTRQGIDAHFRRAQQSFQQRGRGVVPDALYVELLRDMTQEFREGTLVLRSLGTAEVPVDADRYRPAYIASFQAEARWTAEDLQKKVASLLPQSHLPVPQHLHEQVAKELATVTGHGPTAVWTAKTGVESSAQSA
eukprot:TRINITY_DN50201_c0_g1_i1.p1 TRINITY_DN50201_c0_g1~~TRINITY_DN50201_c0_g1_i1.p1  ORF type:complete len:628 (+),score=198.63 TRINITY_DN50201_c0_g1_i1:110-1993(+)